MRWTDFFSHLEYDFALDADSSNQSSHRTVHVDTDFLDLCARAKLSGCQVTVGMVTGEVLHVSPRAVATDWLSGLVGGEHGAGIVIPVWAVLWLESEGARRDGQKTSVVAATLSDVLIDMARRRARVTLRTMHSDVVGVIVGVGRDFLEVAGEPATHATTTRRFPLRAVVAIFQGSLAWG
jgi:hypothetical protein